MSLRIRLAVAAGVAVALAVVAVAVSAYAGTRSQLLGQTDQALHQLAHPFLFRAGVAGGAGAPPGGADGDQQPPFAGAPGAGAGGAGGAAARGGAARGGADGDCDDGLGLDNARGPGFGGAQGYVQLVSPTGAVCLAASETTQLPVGPEVQAVARSGRGSFITDASVGSTHLRVLVHGIGSDGALMVALPLKQVDSALAAQRLLLALICAGGILVAALLGLLVARAALAPITRFTRQTEAIAANPERLDTERLDVHGSDELARLSATFNEMLDALERSVAAQRNLVADASHELRTPIATIRANLQLMRDERLLSPEDREGLRADIIDELDELTALVGDVVELARGSRLTGEPGDVRVDEVVAAAVQRTRRREPQLTVGAALEPTLVRGEGDRIARAVANLLDNAAKYGRAGGRIEVSLSDGVLSVRDHGPGFRPEDLPFVFDRFHRAPDARSRPGSGLGLAIVRQAADAHGGFVQAANAEGGGALLRVSFGPVLALDPEGVPGAAQPADVQASDVQAAGVRTASSSASQSVTAAPTAGRSRLSP